MTTAGELRHKIAFDARGSVEDEYGNTQEGFVEQFTVSAKVQAKFGGEAVTAARLSGEQPVLIVVRQSSQTNQITTDWQARDARSGTIYNIRSIADPDDSRAFWEMMCQSGVAT